MGDRAARGLPLFVAAAGLLAAASAWLLSGTVAERLAYPDYSTLNDGPRGARLFHDALGRAALETRRLYVRSDVPPGSALFRIGEPLSRGALERLLEDSAGAAFVADGGRLVCAFRGVEPGREPPLWTLLSPCATGACDVARTNLPPRAPRLAKDLRVLTLTNCAARASAPGEGAGGDRVPWFSVAAFEFGPEATNRWQTRYAVDGHPVLIEARFGRGSVALATDCYFLSNEALVRDRRTELLAGLVGGARAGAFDETVHGLREARNTAWLLRRYRLHLPLAAFALLFLLTLWQQAVPLLPRRSAASAAAEQRGFRLDEGLVCLLRRHLPAARLPRQLAESWAQTAAPAEAAAKRQELLRAAEAGAAARVPPEQTCRALHQIAQHRRPRAAAPHAATPS